MSPRQEMSRRLRQIQSELIGTGYDWETAQVLLFPAGQTDEQMASLLRARASAAGENPMGQLLSEAAGLYEQNGPALIEPSPS